MKPENICFFILIIMLAGCASPQPMEFNPFNPENKILLKQEGKEEFVYWEMDNDERLWSTTSGNIPHLQTFRDSLELILGPDKFKETIQKELTQNLPSEKLATAENGDRKNALLVHTGTLGKTREMTYTESQLLNYQLGKYPLLGHPTEFHGFILINETTKKVRVYFCSSDQPWPPRPGIIIEKVEEDLQKGWELTFHLHNHYEPSSNDYLGILAPSLADAQYFKMLRDRFNLEKALITNGFHTVEIPSGEFDEFESH